MAIDTQKPILIVSPTYQEVDNLEELTTRIWAAVPEAHLLIVDDASGDGTPGWVGSHQEFGRRLFLIERPTKQGLGTAYVSGFRWALERNYVWIVQIDADLSHDPSDIPRLLAGGSEAELVLASRYLDGVRILNWPATRLALSLGAAAYVRFLTGMPYSDPTGGFKGWKRDLLARFDLDEILSNGYAFQIEMTHTAWRLGAKIAEIPIIFEGRHAGRSKMSGAIAREAVWAVLRMAFRRKISARR
jgi:dolichol-phosphate mannosyltransferase